MTSEEKKQITQLRRQGCTYQEISQENDARAYAYDTGVDAIIDDGTFHNVQEEKKRRSNYEDTENGRQRRKSKYSSKQKSLPAEETH